MVKTALCPLFSWLLFAALLKGQYACVWPEGIPKAYVDSVNSVNTRFLNQIQKIDTNTCSPNRIVFTGSSSVRLWKNLANDFPHIAICNTGFGGSTLPELITYLPQLVLKQKPKGLVVYCGENDISLAYSTVDDIIEQFERLVDSLNLHLPSIPIWYISVKPSILSRAYLEKQDCVNTKIQALFKTQTIQRWFFVDVRSGMLNPEGEPRPELFLRDGLHMNEQGYQIWKTQLQNAFDSYANKK
jgi:lysophospholipase L1-like esterase